MIDAKRTSATSRDSGFEHTLEELRLEAFRVYEAIRTVQRQRDAIQPERRRALANAASLAAGLSERALLASRRIELRRDTVFAAASGRHVARIKVPRQTAPSRAMRSTAHR